MSKNNFNRKQFTDAEITSLVSQINGFKSLFDDRKFKSEKEWRANNSRHMNTDSLKRFYFMIESLHELPTCKICSVKLDIGSFISVGSKKFKKYCTECTSKGAWRFSENIDPTKLTERSKKIAAKKMEFYQTDNGKIIAQTIGTKNSIALKLFHTTEAGAVNRKKSAECNSKIMIAKILSGEFTPTSNNRNTHWESEYNGKKYRSSWEALYQYVNPDAEYEVLRIPYIYNGKDHVYIVDFVDHINKLAIEVKPRELLTDTRTKTKINALQDWANYNSYNVVIFTLESIKLIPEPSYQLFNEHTARKIKKIYATFKN